jgi:hypothetical protein
MSEQIMLNEKKEPSGIGGWLILIAFYTFATPFQVIPNLISCLDTFAPETWKSLTSVNSTYYHPLLAPVLVSELIFYIFMLIISIYMMYLFIKKKSIFRKAFIFLMLFNFVYLFIKLLLSIAIAASILEYEMLYNAALNSLAQSFVLCAVWIPYFKLSKRVKNTFIN